jgi:PAS domain S-box-containing protein
MAECIDRPERVEAPSAGAGPFRALIDNLGQCVYLLDAEGRHAAVNRPFVRWLDRPEAEILGRTAQALWPAPLAEQEEADRRRVLRGERVEREEERPRGGRPCAVHTVKVPVRDGRGAVRGVLGLFTETAAVVEGRAQRASALEALGRVAVGVVHDFNNVLTALRNQLALLEVCLPPPGAPRELLAAMHQAIDRGAALSGRLLAMARQDAPSAGPTDVNAVCREAAGLLKHSMPRSVTLETHLRPGLAPVRMDPTQLTQVLLNLCFNACDAMPRGGRLLLETDEEPGLPDEGPFVCLRVSDTGEGIAPEVRPYVFEPFFTTRGGGRNSGLGLAIVRDAVARAGGLIDCHSEVGRGTRFTISLPASAGWPKADLRPPEAAGQPRQAVTAAPRARQATVLVVDDDPALILLSQTVLQRGGFRVLPAESGEEALELFRRERGTIDLVVLDRDLPGLSGLETLNALLLLDPDVRVLLMTDGAADLTWTRGTQGLGALHRPHTPEQLLAAVRGLLPTRMRDEG